MIVGLTGKAGSGKGTIANYLVDKRGFIKMGLADPIKRMLNDRFGWEPSYWEDREWKEAPHECNGYDGGREYFSPRSWAQWLGTEVGRRLDPDIWVRALSVRLAQSSGNVLIPDIRFDNEAVLADRVILVVREAAPPVSKHSSENGVSSRYVDHVVHNNQSRARLYSIIDEVLGL